MSLMRPSLKPRNLAISTGDFFEQIKGVEIWKGERERDRIEKCYQRAGDKQASRETRERSRGKKSRLRRNPCELRFRN